MIKSILTLSLMAAFAIPLAAETELSGDPEELRQFLMENERREVEIRGTAELRVEADELVARLAIEIEGSQLPELDNRTRYTLSKIIKELVGAGITAENLSADTFPNLNSSAWLRGGFSSAARGLTITLSNSDQLLTIAAIVERYPEASVRELVFRNSNEKELLHKALKTAMEDVRKKEEIYEEALGVTLTPARIILSNESVRNGRPLLIPGQSQSAHLTRTVISIQKDVDSESMAATLSSERIYTAEVEVVYEIQ